MFIIRISNAKVVHRDCGQEYEYRSELMTRTSEIIMRCLQKNPKNFRDDYFRLKSLSLFMQDDQ